MFSYSQSYIFKDKTDIEYNKRVQQSNMCVLLATCHWAFEASTFKNLLYKFNVSTVSLLKNKSSRNWLHPVQNQLKTFNRN